ncbi:MAG: amidophosphoribosyltransferase [bacterium]|nr:amidophosphoribosyltransferase [bacterium]
MSYMRSLGGYCGIFGIYGVDQAASLAVLGLNALQHRGQESCGIVSTEGGRLHRRIGMGLVGEVFSRPEHVAGLPGTAAIGHTRYSTTGSSDYHNIQPIQVITKDGELAMAHNGNLTNSVALRRELEAEGAIFQTTTDSEVILHLLARSRGASWEERIREALSRLKGAFSLVFLSPEGMAVARDPLGFRPLAMGQLEGHPVFASESCAFDMIGARTLRDVEPGELLMVNGGPLHSVQVTPSPRRAHCIFEFVYFSRPDSKIFGENVDKTRRKLGKALAIEHPADEADIVLPVPDSSNTAALGYSRRSEAKFELGLIRNHYIGRTFIRPGQQSRVDGVRLKFNAVEGVLRDRRVVLVDDSVVRGTTMRKLILLLREAGATAVHVRIASPPVRHPCFYGMDFPDEDELAASGRDVEDLRILLGADSLSYLSQEGMLAATGMDPGSFCTACFSGDYPEEIIDAGLPAGVRLPARDRQPGGATPPPEESLS